MGMVFERIILMNTKTHLSTDSIDFIKKVEVCHNGIDSQVPSHTVAIGKGGVLSNLICILRNRQELF